MLILKKTTSFSILWAIVLLKHSLCLLENWNLVICQLILDLAMSTYCALFCGTTIVAESAKDVVLESIRRQAEESSKDQLEKRLAKMESILYKLLEISNK